MGRADRPGSKTMHNPPGALLCFWTKCIPLSADVIYGWFPKNNKRTPPSSAGGKKGRDAVDASAASSSSPRSLKNGLLGGRSGSNSSLVS